MKIARSLVAMLLCIAMLLSTAAFAEAPAEGADTNNGRPYNLTPVKYDNRADKLLNGINATVLPLTKEPVTITYWMYFSSTVMQGMDESLVFQELEDRTGVHVEFQYPPVGSVNENYTTRIASDDLPHIFLAPPGYPGGAAMAVEDGVYVDLTPYYEKGLMPNLKYIVDNNPDIAGDLFDDEGRLLFFPQIDFVTASPWSGLWIRQDYLDELGLKMPTTIAEWDTVLHAIKDAKGGAPLSVNFNSFYGVQTNYIFAAAYESSFRNFLNKDGKAVYGSTEPGYKDFLKLMNKWYTEGILDPDFSTRTFEDYNACVANGTIAAGGLSYAEWGQAHLTGSTLDPDWNLVPVPMPVLEEGQTIKIRQTDSRIREYKEYMTAQAVEDGVDELIVQWMDYRYSQDGGDLCSYGVVDNSFKFNEEGTIEWIFPGLTTIEGADFTTVAPLFKMHNAAYLRDATPYDALKAVTDSIDVWGAQSAEWVMPANITFTTEESMELSDIMADINTYVEEMTYRFITGQSSIDEEYDDYVAQLESMDIARATELYQAALDRYLNR